MQYLVIVGCAGDIEPGFVEIVFSLAIKCHRTGQTVALWEIRKTLFVETSKNF